MRRIGRIAEENCKASAVCDKWYNLNMISQSSIYQTLNRYNENVNKDRSCEGFLFCGTVALNFQALYRAIQSSNTFETGADLNEIAALRCVIIDRDLPKTRKWNVFLSQQI